MKKIILLLILFSMANVCHAATLESKELNLYAKVGYGGKKVINVKKVYDKDTLDVVFNTDFNHYETDGDFQISEEYNQSLWKKLYVYKDLFNTVTYYGYNRHPSDLNYYLTQMFIWQNLFSIGAVMTDSEGNPIHTYDEEYQELANHYRHHTEKMDFFYNNNVTDLWTSNRYTYGDYVTILDNPVVEGLEITNENNDIVINNNKVGKYELTFSKEYETNLKCYGDGVNAYWQNTLGPESISYTMNYEVKGIKLNITETLEGVNNKFGDAKKDTGIFEIYLDGNLKAVTNNFDGYVKSNSSYVLKDIANSVGYIIDDINIDVLDEDYNLNIERKVINKNINFNLLEDKEYLVILKSNNEVYATVNKDNLVINLPYGEYEIVDGDSKIDLSVSDEEDVSLTLGSKKESPKKDKVTDVKKEEIVKEEDKDSDIEVKEEVVMPPLTLDNINSYINLFIINILIIIKSLLKIKKLS